MFLKEGQRNASGTNAFNCIFILILTIFQVFLLLEVLRLKGRIGTFETATNLQKTYDKTNASSKIVHHRSERSVGVNFNKGEQEVRKGDRGIRGIQGPPGLRGAEGRDGRDGLPGLPGTPGISGPRGTKGDPGLNGIKGNPGLTGGVGQKGEQGILGPAGTDCTMNKTALNVVFQMLMLAYRDSPDVETRSQPALQSIAHALSGSGTMYVRWGRLTCPTTGAELLYDGIIASGYFNQAGGGGNYLCLPKDPEWGNYTDGFQTKAYIYGAEYEVSAYNPFSTKNAEVLQDHDAPCAVCYVPSRSVKIMIPARKTCPDNWTREYNGYIVSSHHTHHRSEYICVDEAPETRQGSYVNTEGVRLNPVEASCGSLPCSPYVNGRELTCATCTI